MLKTILRLKSVLILFMGMSLFCPGAFAQGYHDGNNGGYNGQRVGHGSQHYYNNGRWYKHGWFGWGVPVPVLPAGVLIDSLPSSYTLVVVQGQTYYYGNNTYFRQLPAGGFAVVTLPLSN